MEDYRHFVLVVVGENPDELIKPYANNKGKEKFIAFRFKDRSKYKKDYIEMLEASTKEGLIENNPQLKQRIDEEIEYYNSISDEDFYLDITEGYEIDEETGDAFSDKNPDGKYDSCKLASVFAMPMLTNEGKETFSAKKKDINWPAIHGNGKATYEFVWDSVMEGKKPVTPEEKKMYENMKNRTAYFERYGTKENYVESNTAFWGYAFLSDKTGWVELAPNQEQFEWVREFYQRFIEPLSDDALISIYECIRYE